MVKSLTETLKWRIRIEAIIASLICAVLAIGCIGLAPSKAEAGCVRSRGGRQYPHRASLRLPSYRILRLPLPSIRVLRLSAIRVLRLPPPSRILGGPCFIVDGAEHRS